MTTTIWIWVLAAATSLFFGIALFLGKEMLKKFEYFKSFLEASNHLVIHEYKGAKDEGHPCGMRNIVLRAKQPFHVLIGFELSVPVLSKKPGFDYYGYAQSDDEGVVVISTYLGNAPVKFMFMANTDLDTNPVTTSSSEEDQSLTASKEATFPPHFYQRLGIYA